MSIQHRLMEKNIKLPEVSAPAAAYLPYVQTGNLVFISGHIAKQNGKPWVGQLGTNMDTETGKQAAETVAIDLLGTLQAACGGDLHKLKRIVKVMSLSLIRISEPTRLRRISAAVFCLKKKKHYKM